MVNEIINNHQEATFPPAVELTNPVDLRSEVMQEVISQHPGFLEKWALYIFLIILIILFSLAWFITYPDIIEAHAILTGTNTPKEIIIRQEGRLVKLMAHIKGKVKKNETLGFMESNANPLDVLQLSSQIDSSIAMLHKGQFRQVVHGFTGHYDNLGEIQPSYGEFITASQQFDDYIVNGFYKIKAGMLKKDVEALDMTRTTIQQQLQLTEQDLKLAEESEHMNQELFDGKVIAREAFRTEKSKFFAKKMSIPQLEASLLANTTQKRDKQREIYQLEHDLAQQTTLFQQSLLVLKYTVDEWKKKYVITAPVGGEVVLNVPLQENQYFQQGKMIGYIDPGDGHYFAELNLPQANFGKVDTGLQVQLRFDAYPYQEVGFVQGTINYVSNVVSDSGFIATVRLDSGLVTSNNRTVIYKTGLRAQAIVITRNTSLLKRLVNNTAKFISVGSK